MLRRRKSQQRTGGGSEPGAPGAPGAALSGRWQAPAQEATAARARFAALVAGVPAGPLRDRLDALRARLDAAVEQVVAIATRAQQVESTVEALSAGSVTDQLKDVRRRLSSAPEGPDRDRLRAAVDALAAQHASLNRMHNAVEDAERRLRLLDLRIDAAVAQAAELALLGDRGDLAPVERELQGVVDELAALQAGLREVGGSP